MDELSLTAGVRVDGFDARSGAETGALDTKWAVSPRIALSTELHNATVVASFGRFAQAPDFQYLVDAAFDDIRVGGRRNMQALCLDVTLFARDWGFALEDIRVPVHLWYGDADIIVPLHHGEHMAKQIPGATLRVRPGEGHLGGLGASREIFEALLAHWPA